MVYYTWLEVEKLKSQYKKYWDEVSRRSYYDDLGNNLCEKIRIDLKTSKGLMEWHKKYKDDFTQV